MLSIAPQTRAPRPHVPPSPVRQTRIFRSPVLLAALVALVGVCAPGFALAAPGAGTVALTLGGEGKAGKALAANGVEASAIAPAKKRGKRLALPVRSIVVGKSASVKLSGGVRLEAGRRSIGLRSVRVKLTARRAVVSARIGKRRVGVFAAELHGGAAKLDRAKAIARLTGVKLGLTRRGARLLRGQLALSSLPHGLLGKLGINAKGTGGETKGGGGGGQGQGGSGPGGVPQSGPIANESPLKPRPASAVDVTDIAIAWYPRDSWVRYLASGVGPQDGTFATGGAWKGAPMTSPAHPCSDAAYGGAPSDSFDYELHFAPKSGWYDPPTGTAAIYGSGNASFKWASHGIDLTASDPEIEIDPANPRAIFRFNGSGGTAYPNQRAVLTKLDLTGQPTISNGGRTRTYSAVRGRLTEDGQAVFAGFYPPPNDGFGCVTVAFTTP
jgi:hypothetical protein